MGDFVEIMEDLSNFVERLDSLLFDNHLTVPEVAKHVDVSESTLYSYLRKDRQPDTIVLVRIADYFEVTTDFLLGREPESRATRFRPCPPFSEQIRKLLVRLTISKRKFCEKLPVTRSVLYYWMSGKSIPSLDYLIRLADYFKCSTDYILGREY